MMDRQRVSVETSTETSIGCGLLGCTGGAFLGLVGGALLLILLSLIVAIASPVPTPLAANTSSDLRLTVHENFLNRFIQSSAEDTVQVDILPGNQFSLRIDTTVSLLGMSIPLQMVGLFEFQLNGQSIELRLISTKVSDVTLPPELTEYFDDALPGINQELNVALDNVSAVLGVPLVFVDLGSDDTTFWLEAREAR
jgi:hypothetical protein